MATDGRALAEESASSAADGLRDEPLEIITRRDVRGDLYHSAYLIVCGVRYECALRTIAEVHEWAAWVREMAAELDGKE